MTFKKIAQLFTILSLLSACAVKEESIDLSLKYSSDKGPKLNIKNYLNGDLEGWGYIEKNGMITKRFTAKMKGKWDGNKAVIKRNFSFNDGKKDNRTWLITLDDDNFSAVGHGVIGTAKGQQYKGVAKMIYTVKMELDGVKQKTNVSETIFNIDNKSSISILEFRVGGQNKGKMILSLHKVKGAIKKKSIKTKSLDEDIKNKVEPSKTK